MSKFGDYGQFCRRHLARLGEKCRGIFNELNFYAIGPDSSNCLGAIHECETNLETKPPEEAMRIFNARIRAIRGKGHYFSAIEQAQNDQDNVLEALHERRYADAAGILIHYRPDIAPVNMEPFVRNVMERVTDDSEIKWIVRGLFTEGWYGPK